MTELSVKYIASWFSLLSHFIPIEMDLYIEICLTSAVAFYSQAIAKPLRNMFSQNHIRPVLS